MMVEVILALDIGSSSARCSAYRIIDASVEALAGCSNQRQIRSVQPNTGKIDVHLLLNEIDVCVDTTLQALRKTVTDFQVVGLGFSTFVMNLVAVDQQGEVVGQEATLSYACNSSEVANECKTLRRELGEERLKELYQKTGAPLHSAYALVQLRALYSHHPVVVERIDKWQTVASVCLARWQGLDTCCIPISFSEASWTGLFNFSTCIWEETALELLPEQCRNALPELADYCNDVSYHITEFTSDGNKNPYYDRWPELQETCRLFLGIGDGACANVGSKCSTPNRIAVTVGTSAAARVCLPFSSGVLHVPPGLFCYRIDHSHVLVGGALTDGGSVVEWARSLLNLDSQEAFQECMKEVEQLMEQEASPSLSVVPFLSGERSTGFRDGATGCIVGLTRETTPAKFVKACMEGVTLRLKAVLKLVCETIPTSDEQLPYIVVSGNAMEKNGVWRQMLADATGMQVFLDTDVREGTSRGVARLIAIALARQSSEQYTSSSEMLMGEESIRSPIVASPRQSVTEGYWARATETQDGVIEAVSPLW